MEALLEQALREAGGNVELEARIHASWARTLWETARPNLAEPHAKAALALAEKAQDKALLAAALAYLAVVDMCLGRGVRSDLLDRALVLEADLDGTVPVDALPSYYHVLVQLMTRDELDAARQHLERAREAAAALGREEGVAVLTVLQSELECWAGRWDEAERWAKEGLELIAQSEAFYERPLALYGAALADAYRGRCDEARSRALEVLESTEQAGQQVYSARARMVLGVLELSLGRPAAVVDWLEPVYRAYRAGGFVEPGIYRFLPDMVEALVGLGRPGEARELLEPFEAAARRLGRRFAAGASARCRALLLAAEGQDAGAHEAAAESVRALLDSGQPFELARSLLVLGSVERRRRRKSAAAKALREALDLFEELGAPLWAERARSELGRVGLRPRAPSELTATERTVAKLAAAGHRNEEIAALALLTVKTVEANLTRVYRKLGVRSRHQLAGRLAD